MVLLFPNPISMIPNGFMYVAKRFRANGFDTCVQVNSFAAYKTVDDYYDYVVAQRPDAVGLSYATMNLLEIYRLQRRLQEKGYLVIAGGDHPTICPDEVLQNGADLVVRGEGELGHRRRVRLDPRRQAPGGARRTFAARATSTTARPSTTRPPSGSRVWTR